MHRRAIHRYRPDVSRRAAFGVRCRDSDIHSAALAGAGRHRDRPWLRSAERDLIVRHHCCVRRYRRQGNGRDQRVIVRQRQRDCSRVAAGVHEPCLHGAKDRRALRRDEIIAAPARPDGRRVRESVRRQRKSRLRRRHRMAPRREAGDRIKALAVRGVGFSTATHRDAFHWHSGAAHIAADEERAAGADLHEHRRRGRQTLHVADDAADRLDAGAVPLVRGRRAVVRRE